MKDSLLNIQTRLRDPHNETCEGGKVEKVGVQRPGCRHSLELTVGLGRGGISLQGVLSAAPGAEMRKERFCLSGQQTAAEPSDLGRDRAQRCDSCVLVATTATRKTKPQHLAASLTLPELAAALKKL